MARDRFAVLRDRLAGVAAERGEAATAGALARLAHRPDACGATDLPVLGCLDDALVRTGEEVDADLAEALGVLARGATLAQGEDAALGLLLLGPGLHYPLHHPVGVLPTRVTVPTAG